jgi:hypothetical protein
VCVGGGGVVLNDKKTFSTSSTSWLNNSVGQVQPSRQLAIANLFAANLRARLICARQRVYIRYALAYRKQPLLSAVRCEKGAWHTRLEAALYAD